MHIGIVSDTHGNRRMVMRTLAELRRARHHDRAALRRHQRSGNSENIYRGLTMHIVFGNCDIDKCELRAAMADIGATLHEHFGSIALEGVKLAFTHGDNSTPDARRGALRLLRFPVLRPHAPSRGTSKAAPTHVINPGAVHRAQAENLCGNGSG